MLSTDRRLSEPSPSHQAIAPELTAGVIIPLLWSVQVFGAQSYYYSLAARHIVILLSLCMHFPPVVLHVVISMVALHAPWFLQSSPPDLLVRPRGRRLPCLVAHHFGQAQQLEARLQHK